MPSLRAAILATRRYARFFDFDLTFSELHHWLISTQHHSFSAVKQISRLTDQLTQKRLLRQKYSRRKIDRLLPTVRLLGLLPTIRLIALTGSLAMDNAQKNDDLDLLFITSPHTLWLTRPFVYLILRLLNLRRSPHLSHSSPEAADKICDNLWLDTLSLAVPRSKRNLYTAHEVLQVRSLFDRNNTHSRFIRANSWTRSFLANAYKETAPMTRSEQKTPPSPWFIRVLNAVAFRLQYLYMRPKITTEYITLHSAYFHPRDLHPRLERFLNSFPSSRV